jgi:hypothetical protein
LGLLIASGYALLVTGLGIILTGGLPVVLSGLAIFALALLLNPLRRYFENRVDALFFRGERAYQEQVQTFATDLTRVVDAVDILAALRKFIQGSLSPRHVHIYTYDILSEQYAASADETGQPTSDLRFPATSGLVKVLEKQQAALFISRQVRCPPLCSPNALVFCCLALNYLFRCQGDSAWRDGLHSACVYPVNLIQPAS